MNRIPAAILGALLLASPGIHAAETSLDSGQRKIVATAMDELISRLGALAGRFPQLTDFSDPKSITRDESSFHYRARGANPYEFAVQFRALDDKVPRPPKGLSTWLGGSRFGGIGFNVSSTADPLPLHKAVGQVVDDVFNGTLLRLAAEYDLRKEGVPLDTASLVSATASRENPVAEKAAVALRFRDLTAAQTDEIVKTGTAAALEQLACTLEDRNDAGRPLHLLHIAQRCVAIEKEGADTFTPSPAFGVGADSNSRDTRAFIARLAASDPQLLPAASFLVASDPAPGIRKSAMESLSQLPPSAERGRALAAALANPDRRIQAAAASALAAHPEKDAAAALTALLDSPAADVRAAAAKALNALDLPHPLNERKLPATARKMAKTLRDYGLTDADIIYFLSRPADAIFPPAFDPEALPRLPNWVKLDAQPGDLTENGKIVGHTTNYALRLDNKFPMVDLSPYSVEQRTALYECGFGLDWSCLELDPTGPFLLAAALEIGDEDSARRVYERMALDFPTDADALDRGLTAIAWLRFEAALAAYQRYRDDRAREMFQDVLQFQRVAKPFTPIASYLALSRQLLPRLGAKTPAPPPAGADRQALIAYWIKRIPEINGDMPGQPASPAIWKADNGFYDGTGFARFPFASDKLREFGLEAMPALIEVADDQAPTRTVGWWRDFVPDRYVLDVGSIAREIIWRICKDNAIDPPKFLSTPTTRPFASSPPIVDKLRDWWKKSAPKPPAANATEHTNSAR